MDRARVYHFCYFDGKIGELFRKAVNFVKLVDAVKKSNASDHCATLGFQGCNDVREMSG